MVYLIFYVSSNMGFEAVRSAERFGATIWYNCAVVWFLPRVNSTVSF